MFIYTDLHYEVQELEEYGKMKMDYDVENDILFIHKGFSKDEKFKGNIDAGDIVLDMSTKGRIVGIEILNASEFLKAFKIGKKVLESLKDARFKTQIKCNSIMIELVFLSHEEEIPAKIALPIAR